MSLETRSVDRKDRTTMVAVATPARIGLADRGRRMTVEEFMGADETEGCCYELARGVPEVTEVPDDPHGWTFVERRGHAPSRV
jgi:hypothetical protein